MWSESRHACHFNLLVTQSASMGAIQNGMAEVRDLGVNLGCDGAEGGPK